jgi:hypothetical protein
MQVSSTYSHFIQALNVMNGALESPRDLRLSESLSSACTTNLGGRNLVVAIETEREGEPDDYFTIRLQEGAFVLVAHEKKSEDIDWRVSEKYLKDVANRPKWYLDDPRRLDFQWLSRLVRVSATHEANADS